MQNNCKLQKAECEFIEYLKSFCQADANITNAFLYGSVAQPKSQIDKLSDLDVIILQNKFKSFNLEYKNLIFLNENVYDHFRCLEFMLKNGRIIDLTIFTEKEWKKKWHENPLFYASVLKRGIKFLVKKNDFISSLPAAEMARFYIQADECKEIWQEFVSTYFDIVKMYIRKDIWRIYGYGIRLAKEISRLISLKARIDLYKKYRQKKNVEEIFSDSKIVFANNNWLQIGRDFNKYATPRQKQIFKIIHKLTETNVDDLLMLYDLSSEEFSELKDYQIKFQEENVELFRKYAVLRLTGKDEITSYLKQRRINNEQLCKVIEEFL